MKDDLTQNGKWPHPKWKTTSSKIENDPTQNGRWPHPKWKTTKNGIRSYRVKVKVEPNLTAGKQTVIPCHHGGWGSLDSISGMESNIKLCFSPLTDWLSGLQFMTGRSLSQAGFALERSTPQLILMLANASNSAVFKLCLKRCTLDVLESVVSHRLKFLEIFSH